MSSSGTIIALHGAGMQAGAWEPLSPHLDFRAISFPGHGEMPAPFLTSIEKMAAWVAKQLDAHGEKSVVLMGHSMGALVAVEAAKHPAVAALALIGAAMRMPVNPDLLKQAADAPAAAAELILKWGVAKTNPAAREILQGQMQPDALFNDLSACNAYAGVITPSVPALVIAGAEDKMTPAASGEALAANLKARFRVIPAAGHMLMAERPAEIAKEIKAFMQDQEAG